MKLGTILNNRTLLAITTAVFILLPAFVLPVGTRYFPISFFVLAFSFIFLILALKTKFIGLIKELCSLRTSKLFLIFALWVIVDSLLLIFIGKMGLFKPLMPILLGIFASLGLLVFLGFLFVSVLGIKKSMKYIYSFLYAINVIGIINFFIFTFKIDWLSKIYFFFVNKRLLVMNWDAQVGNLIPRIQSVFEEPSFLAFFICINLPLVYAMTLCKAPIYKNPKINKFVKYTAIPLMWIVLLGTLSPINIIFGVIISVIYYLIISKVSLKKVAVYTFSICFSLIIFYFLVDAAGEDSKVFYRIKMVLYSIGNFESFVLMEPSLATRVVYAVNMFIIFLQNPFLGVGIGNLSEPLYYQIDSSPVPLTLEISVMALKALSPAAFGYTPSIFFRFIAELGFIGIGLLYAFFFQMYVLCGKLSRFFLKGEYSRYFFGLKYMFLTFLILSFYSSDLYLNYYWIMCGIALGAYCKCRKIAAKKEYKNEKNT